MEFSMGLGSYRLALNKKAGMNKRLIPTMLNPNTNRNFNSIKVEITLDVTAILYIS